MQEKIQVLEREQIDKTHAGRKMPIVKMQLKTLVIDLITTAEYELYDGENDAIDTVQELVQELKHLTAFTENRCVAMQERARRVAND
jgi:hypothetical protein